MREAMGRYKESGGECVLCAHDGVMKALSREVRRPDLCLSEMQPGRDLRASALEASASGERLPSSGGGALTQRSWLEAILLWYLGISQIDAKGK